MIMEDAKIVRKTSYCLEILYDKWINILVYVCKGRNCIYSVIRFNILYLVI